MPGTQITCTLDVSGTHEQERRDLIQALEAELNTSTGLHPVTIRPVRDVDATTVISFLATGVGSPSTSHVALIESVVRHALEPSRRDNRPVSVAIASVYLERLRA